MLHVHWDIVNRGYVTVAGRILRVVGNRCVDDVGNVCVLALTFIGGPRDGEVMP